MNGKDLLEALSFVDEKYIEDAQCTPARRPLWQGAAALAACLALVLLGWRTVNLSKQTHKIQLAAVYDSAESVAEAALDRADSNSLMMASPLPTVTVRVDGTEDGILLCTVTAPGEYPVGTQLRIAPPETDEVRSTSAAKEPVEYVITYHPGEGDILQAVDIQPVGDAHAVDD